MGINLSPMQQDAVDKAFDWWLSDVKQVFSIVGFAGTGKTTIVNALVDRIGIEAKNYRFVTFTGKASLVLRQKGLPATTIHKLIKEVEEVTEIVVYYDNAGNKIEKPITKIKFRNKPALESEIKLIVVDEVSMVSVELLDDILSYGVKVITLGDSGQLQPVSGDINEYIKNPDVSLTEIHRQAENSPIIYLSMLARTGKRINIGSYGKDACVLSKDELYSDLLLRADQVICGKNQTREELNHMMRKFKYGDDIFEKEFLPIVGDKLICLKNNWEEEVFDLEFGNIPLINGLIGYCSKIDKDSMNYYENSVTLNFRPEFLEEGIEYKDLDANLFQFVQNKNDFHMRNGMSFNREKNKNKSIKEIENQIAMQKNPFTWGYAITCHKSQGSQWNRLLVYNEYMGFGNPGNHHKWLYTAITRAAKKLIIAI